MSKSPVLAFAMTTGLLAPSAALASPLGMRFNLALADGPKTLTLVVGVWSVCCLLALGRRLWIRHRRDPDERLAATDMLGRAAGYAFWALLPWLLLSQLVDRAFFENKLDALPIAVVWALLAGPALALPIVTQRRRVIRWISLGVADIAALTWLLHAFLRQERGPHFFWIAAFAILLHGAAMMPKRGHAVFRLLGLAGLLFFAANLLQPPGALSDLRPLNSTAIRQLSEAGTSPRLAVLTADGSAALIVAEAEPTVLRRVSLSTGKPVDEREFAGDEIRLVATHPETGDVFVVTDSDTTPVHWLDGDLLFTRAVFHGTLPFAPRAAVLGDSRLAVGGDGEATNLLLCDLRKAADTREVEIADTCAEIAVPLARIGNMVAVPKRRVIFAAEGAKWFADGWRVQQIGLANGEIIRRVTLPRGVGVVAHNELDYSLYTTVAGYGAVDVRYAESLETRGGWRVEPGLNFLRLDPQRSLFVAASTATGTLVVADLTDGKRVAELKIGSGIRGLDYYRKSGTALVAARRGVVVVDILKLPGIRGSYEIRTSESR
ncbi:MAG: hypothetical protein P9L99_09330 [Candidatus Lernaella stagnicola]|nr:hypothetical protein [Candidatus Lernaella stagnicola]